MLISEWDHRFFVGGTMEQGNSANSALGKQADSPACGGLQKEANLRADSDPEKSQRVMKASGNS
jgi:hypothetical protein